MERSIQAGRVPGFWGCSGLFGSVPKGRQLLCDKWSGFSSGPLPKHSLLPQIKLLSVSQIRTGLWFLAAEDTDEVFPATGCF